MVYSWLAILFIFILYNAQIQQTIKWNKTRLFSSIEWGDRTRSYERYTFALNCESNWIELNRLARPSLSRLPLYEFVLCVIDACARQYLFSSFISYLTYTNMRHTQYKKKRNIEDNQWWRQRQRGNGWWRQWNRQIFTEQKGTNKHTHSHTPIEIAYEIRMN